MKKLTLALVLVFAVALGPARAVVVTVNSWQPLFKGIDYATGQQDATVFTDIIQKVNCMRIDLTDPDVVLFTTPHCTNSCGSESLAENTSHFLVSYRLQVAMNCNFYGSSFGPADLALGSPEAVLGLALSKGDP